MTELAHEKIQNKIFSIIKWSLFLLLIGKGFLHFTSEQPYTYLFGKNILPTYIFGTVLILTSIFSVFEIKLKNKIIINILLIFSSLIIFLHSYGTFIKAGYVAEQLIEHSLQICLPLVFLFLMNDFYINKIRLGWILICLTALTFIGHGIYAIGWHYLPDNFIEMTERSIGYFVPDPKMFLFTIGILDIILSLFLFIPKLRPYVLWYFIIWGFATSIARVYYVLDTELTNEFLLVNAPNMIYRLLHGLIPLAIYYHFQKKNNTVKQNKNLDYRFKMA
jgi:uncharacterized membrane protein